MKYYVATLLVLSTIALIAVPVIADEESNRQILKQGLLGAGVGAVAAGTSGGNAGQGALIGAGTGILGNALLDAITGDSSSGSRKSSRQAAEDEEYYYADEPEEYYYEEEPPQKSASQSILGQGLVGAGVGAISAGASGGDAGKGALIGAGTNVIGSALLDTITEQPRTRRGRVYRKVPVQQTQQTQQQYQQTTETQATEEGTRKKIIRKYDESGKVVSEEEIYY